jgi:hypothetical protein
VATEAPAAMETMAVEKRMLELRCGGWLWGEKGEFCFLSEDVCVVNVCECLGARCQAARSMRYLYPSLAGYHGRPRARVSKYCVKLITWVMED